MIAQGADMQTVVRLLCLASVITGGIKAKNLENIKRELLQACLYTKFDSVITHSMLTSVLRL